MSFCHDSKFLWNQVCAETWAVTPALRILQPFQESQPSRWAIISPATQQLATLQHFFTDTYSPGDWEMHRLAVMSCIQQTYNKLPRNIVPVEWMVHKTERKLISLVVRWKMFHYELTEQKCGDKIRCILYSEESRCYTTANSKKQLLCHSAFCLTLQVPSSQ